MIRLAYDFDGVLCDTMPAFERHWQDKFDWTIPSGRSRQFHMPLPPEHTDYEVIGKEIEEAIHNYQTYLKPHAFAMEYMDIFAEKLGQRPLIITARSDAATADAIKWLDVNYGLDYSIWNVQLHGDKVRSLRSLEVTHYIEDRFRTVGQLADELTKVYMMNRPWNQGRTHRGFDNIVRVNNLVDVYLDIFED